MSFAFGKKNYYILGAGLLLLIIGYFLMSGGAATSADEFNAAELFIMYRDKSEAGLKKHDAAEAPSKRK
jgi:hypothetical protein